MFRWFGDLLKALPEASVIAVDIPIGLPEQGKRDCDTAARRALSPTRNPPGRRPGLQHPPPSTHAPNGPAAALPIHHARHSYMRPKKGSVP